MGNFACTSICVRSVSEWIMIHRQVKIQEKYLKMGKYNSHACFDGVELPAKVPVITSKFLNTFVNLALSINACGKSRNNACGKCRFKLGHAV